MFVWEKRSEYKTPTAWNSNGIPCRGQWFQTINVLFRASFALPQILLGGGEHEFDSVELVDFAGTGVMHRALPRCSTGFIRSSIPKERKKP